MLVFKQLFTFLSALFHWNNFFMEITMTNKLLLITRKLCLILAAKSLYNLEVTNLGAELALNVVSREADKFVAETLPADGHELADAAIHGGQDARNK
jgi:hypothetical protein